MADFLDGLLFGLIIGLLLALLAGCGKLYIKQRAPLVVDHNVHVMSREEIEIYARLFCRSRYQMLPESSSKDALVEQCVDDEVDKILGVK